jgi:hypothetical protein
MFWASECFFYQYRVSLSLGMRHIPPPDSSSVYGIPYFALCQGGQRRIIFLNLISVYSDHILNALFLHHSCFMFKAISFSIWESDVTDTSFSPLPVIFMHETLCL